ncbi:MAG: DUF6776 family protein [Pseudomonadales bacterium]
MTLPAKHRSPRVEVADGNYRLVTHRSGRRALWLSLVGLVVVASFGLGFWLGGRTADLDRSYLAALEVRDRAGEAKLNDLNRQLVDVRLARDVEQQAAQELRQDMTALRDEMAGLQQEVIFYKSLMAPSTLQQGLQIAELELARGASENQFTYHILLTQVEARRDWVQGKLDIEVHGRADGKKRVLALADIADVDAYPTGFRFRYFQDLTGVLSLPDGFRPESVSVTALLRGRSDEAQQRSFDWVVKAG